MAREKEHESAYQHVDIRMITRMWCKRNR